MADLKEKRKWDAIAFDHQEVFEKRQNEYSIRLMTFLKEKEMFWPGCRVLDVGCGVGKYGVYFARLGCDVTLTDISDEMLNLASKNMESFDTPWRVYAGDFNDFTGKEDVFKEGFDLSISTMSPAIHDYITVKKLSDMTKGHCFVTKFYDWKQPFRDILGAAMGEKMTPRIEKGKESCGIVIQAIKEAGFEPNVIFVDYNWSDKRTPEEMADYLLRHEWRDRDDKDLLREKATKACSKLSKDGTVDDCVNTKVAWIYWNTRRDMNGLI